MRIWHWVWARFYHYRGELHRHLGNLHGDLREYHLAVADFTRAIELWPDLIQAHYNRGLLFWRELRDPTQAIRDLTRVIERDPDWAEPWFNRAIAHQNQGNVGPAIADYKRYLALGSDPEWRQISLRRLQDLRRDRGGEEET